MNPKNASIFGAAAIAVIALIFAYPVFASTSLSTPMPAATNVASTSTQTISSIVPLPQALTVGQTITFTSTAGQWKMLSAPSKPEVSSGVASGTVTLTVTGVYKRGYALSITAGSLDINGTTFAIASGTSEMGPYQAHLLGQGSFASASPGSFLMGGAAHADFFGATFNTLRFDVQANSIEYGVLLVVSATHS